MKIYLAGPISGQNGPDVISYFSSTAEYLMSAGYEVIHPMLGKGSFRNEIKILEPEGYILPQATNHAIIERDCWMVQQCDILYCNFTNCGDRISIGSCMELAWGHILGKHTVVAMQPDNIHRHAFVMEAADVIFETHQEALDYLLELKN